MENKTASRSIKGTAFREDYDYLKRKKGSMGLKEIEKRMAKAGYPLKLENVNITKWYPIEYRTAHLYAIKEAFGWSDLDIFNMATESPKVATTMRFFLKYIVSPETAFKSASKYWDNYFLLIWLQLY